MKKLLYLSILLSLVLPVMLRSDDAPVVPAQGGAVRPVHHTDIEMVRERIDIYMKEDHYQVTVEYLFRNTGASHKVTMGFPNKSNAFYSSTIRNFSATVDGVAQEIHTRPAHPEEKVNEWQARDLYECFDTSFNAGEEKKVTNRYTQHYVHGYDTDWLWLEYILTTGAFWKGRIGTIDVYVHYGSQPFYNFSATGPGNAETEIDESARVIHYRYRNVEPEKNFTLRFPSLIQKTESSGHLASRRYDYSPKSAHDNDLSTAWVEGERDDGIGEWLTFSISPGVAGGKLPGGFKVSKIGIINGCAKDDAIFAMNNRVKKFTLRYIWFDTDVAREGTARSYTLRDTRNLQFITFPQPVYMSEVTFQILDVYRGTKYRDTCISEVRFYVEE